MIDFPKWLNTPFDVEYCMEHFPEQMKQRLKEMAEDTNYWQASDLAAKEKGLEDATHKIDIAADGTKRQLVWAAKPSSHLTRLNIKAEDISKFLVAELLE